MSEFDEYNILPKRFIDLRKSVIDTSDLDKARAELDDALNKLEKATELLGKASDTTRPKREIAHDDAKSAVDEAKKKLGRVQKNHDGYNVTFSKKVYYDRVSNKFPLGYLPKWARKTQHLQSGGILQKRARFGYVPVNVKEHQVLPEPFDNKANIDENGHIVYVDMLLCYIPYDKLIKKRTREVTKGDANLRASFKNFDDQLRESGAELDPEEREKLEQQRKEALGV